MTDRSKAATHAEGCCSWGPAHYECAVREIERLRKMHQDAYQRGFQEGSRGLREAYDAIQEVKRQDAWGNTRLTEALMAAEERAERAETENKRLLAEVAAMREALDALKAENEMLREALKDADSEMDWLDEDMDTCDHSVGVCMCSYWSVRRKMKAALAQEDRND